MPWRCPACRVQITHNDFEAKPRVSARYRCHICRLELILDAATDRLVPMPFEESADRTTSHDRLRKSVEE